MDEGIINGKEEGDIPKRKIKKVFDLIFIGEMYIAFALNFPLNLMRS
jgi:hypothetical protein